MQNSMPTTKFSPEFIQHQLREQDPSRLGRSEGSQKSKVKPAPELKARKKYSDPLHDSPILCVKLALTSPFIAYLIAYLLVGIIKFSNTREKIVI
ncbi:hypothetical protein PoB_000196900 [Plakobranchus ocellatus]|uniref:Uncharacterized protein n=1 Tax=Plakobranchus ocellatus TaxID=259542 RepID=A0AAV3XX92_9GAST|nr:hypothetical protein PoB_000196900 [Plakobranchus ocellatus]